MKPVIERRTSEEGCVITNDTTGLHGETVTLEVPELQRPEETCYDESGVPWGTASERRP